MIILVEGPDGSGKTTLINQLIPKIRAPRIKLNFKYPEETTTEENIAYARGEYEGIVRNLFTLLSYKYGYNIICDRFHLGEFVYGPVMRDYPEPEALETIRRVEWLMMKDLSPDKVKLIVLNCSPSTLAKRAYNDKYVKLKDLIKIQKRYKTAFDLSGLFHKRYINTDELNPEEAFYEAMKFLGSTGVGDLE